MKSLLIILDNHEKVRNFVEIVSKYDFDVDIRSKRYLVNAKSILGIFSLDLKNPLILEIYADDCYELLSELKPFIKRPCNE